MKPPIRVSVTETKRHLSKLLRNIDQEPVIIHSRGRDIARLVAPAKKSPFVVFFERMEKVRRRLGMKGVDFTTPPASIRPVDPF